MPEHEKLVSSMPKSYVTFPGKGGEKVKLTSFEEHQKKIAEATLKMPDPIANVMGGMTKKEAKEFLDKLSEQELKEESEKI
jgi:hypothetical protein